MDLQTLKLARERRVAEAQVKLDNEVSAHHYLVEMGRLGAAKMAEENIIRMEKTVARFRADLLGL